MAITYKILGQQAPTTTAETTLYTVPASTQTVVSSLTVTNLTSSSATATVSVCFSGAATANANTLLKTVTIPALSVQAFTIGLTIGATDVVRVTSSAGNALAFQLFGSENS